MINVESPAAAPSAVQLVRSPEAAPAGLVVELPVISVESLRKLKTAASWPARSQAYRP